MYILVLIIPLISAITAGLFGRKLGTLGSGILTTSYITFTCLLSWLIYYEVGIMNSVTTLQLWNWFTIAGMEVNIGLLFDTITAVMLVVITTISALVHLYSTEYMRHDPHLPRFMSYLSLFTFFMLILVTANNLIQLFIGWEGVGLASYLLINFWFTRIQANKAAMKAMIMNRVGDVGIAIAIYTAYVLFKSVDFITMNSIVHLVKDDTIAIAGIEINGITLMGILILIAAVGKSAQIGLHGWLGDAMEGPTPVSALIHAATMVTAGVFILIRTSYILEYSNTALMVIVIVGAITAFFAATVGVVQNDIKKVIAYSTCSQLGYMVFACGLSNYGVSIFHLMNHAFFKALLFLSAGSVIHAMMDEQDIRKLGAMIKAIPFTYAMILIGSLSLMGIPYLTGFYSKDAIIEIGYGKYAIEGTFAHWLGTISASFTAFYSIRLIYITFITDSNASQRAISKAHESPWAMSLPLFLLSIGSIFVGYIFKDMFIGMGSSFFGGSISVLPEHLSVIDAEFLPAEIKIIPVIFSIFGALLATYLYSFKGRTLIQLKYTSIGKKVYTFINNKWNFDYVYNSFIIIPLLSFGYNVCYKLIDRAAIEWIGPWGIMKTINQQSMWLSRIQSGIIYQYAFLIFISATVLITIIAYSEWMEIIIEILCILPVVYYLYYKDTTKITIK